MLNKKPQCRLQSLPLPGLSRMIKEDSACRLVFHVIKLNHVSGTGTVDNTKFKSVVFDLCYSVHFNLN